VSAVREMKKLALLLLCLVAAGFGYRYLAVDRAEKQYEAFAEEILHRRYDAAARMVDSLTAADLERLGSQEQIGAGPAMFQTIFVSRFDIQSRTAAPDGSVVFNATQLVRFNPVGVESAVRPAMFATLRQVVTLRKSAGEWKVTAFENVFQSLDTTPSR
jgi:hypothetical protein